MPGTNAGTGQPYNFQCSKCRKMNLRRERLRIPRTGTLGSVELTGKKKPRRSNKGGSRVSAFVRQYKCNDCDHVGWSNHTDLEHKEKSNEGS